MHVCVSLYKSGAMGNKMKRPESWGCSKGADIQEFQTELDR